MRKFKIICSADTLLQEEVQRDVMSYINFFHLDKTFILVYKINKFMPLSHVILLSYTIQLSV